MTRQSLRHWKPIPHPCRTYSERRDAGSLPLLAGVLALAVSGCYRAPTVSGPNQVWDPNVEVTAAKDNEFETMSWPSVDSAMSVLVPDPGNEPGCAVGVVRDDEILYLQGYGYARLPGRGDPGELWSVATMGAVGSVAKTFTAAAVMRMHDLGLIDVNDQVEDYLATGNGPLGNTYIYDLLGHASGVGGDTQDKAFGHDWEDGTSVTDCIENDPESASCLALFQELARPASAFPYYAPTEAVADLGMAGDLKAGVYSNVGYSVLGAIVDQVARDSTSSDGYEAFVWDEIGSWAGNFLESGNMLSLALTHSWRDEDIPHRAVGYVGDGPAIQEAWDQNSLGPVEGWEGPSGGWAMTIGDLSRFMIALDNADFFDDADMRAIMQHEWTDLIGFDDHYGFGIFLGTGASLSPDYWHGGTIGPHNAIWAWWENYPSTGDDIGVAIICNRGSAGVWTLKSRAAVIADIAAFGNPQPAAEVEIRPLGPRETQGLDGRAFELDTSAAWQEEPKGAIIPMTGLSRRLQLRPQVSNGHIVSFELAERRRDRRGAKLERRPVATLWALHSSNPRFQTHPEAVTLETDLGAVVVSDLEIEGSFSDRGDTLSHVALSGTVDTRQMTRWASRLGKNHRKSLPTFERLCRSIEEAGSSCRPCADEVIACVDVRYEGLRGIAADSPSRNSAR